MKKKFCPKCGREADHFIEGLCDECFKERFKLIEVPEKIKIMICKNCGRINGIDPKKQTIEDVIRKKIKIRGKIKNLFIKETKKIGKKIYFDIEAIGKIGNIQKNENEKTVVLISERLCDYCGKVKGGYYEAIIQLRSENNENIANAFENINKIMKNNKGLLTKIEKRSNGIDIYITPKSLVDKIIRNIPHKETKKSYSLVTIKEGKDLYRTTLLLRL